MVRQLVNYSATPPTLGDIQFAARCSGCATAASAAEAPLFSLLMSLIRFYELANHCKMVVPLQLVHCVQGLDQDPERACMRLHQVSSAKRA